MLWGGSETIGFFSLRFFYPGMRQEAFFSETFVVLVATFMAKPHG